MADQTAIEQILGDIPKIQQIASAPFAKHPLLNALLDLAVANAQVGKWAVDVQALLAQQPEPEAPAMTVVKPEAANGKGPMPASKGG